MTTDTVSDMSPEEDPRRRNSVAALRAWLEGPPALTPEEGLELDRIIMDERNRSLLDFYDDPFEGARHNDLLSRISIDPNLCSGEPCVRGGRVAVSHILDLLAGGMAIPKILETYPAIEEADVLACIAYGADSVRKRHRRAASN